MIVNPPHNDPPQNDALNNDHYANMTVEAYQSEWDYEWTTIIISYSFARKEMIAANEPQTVHCTWGLTS